MSIQRRQRQPGNRIQSFVRLFPVLLCLLSLLAGCCSGEGNATRRGKIEQEGVATLSFILSYTNEDATEIVTEDKTLSLSKGLTNQEKAEAVLDILKKGVDSTRRSVIPEGMILGVQVQSLNYSETLEGSGYVLILAVGEAYNDISPSRWTVMRTGLSEAFFSSGLVDRIEIVYCNEQGNQVMVDSVESSDRVLLNQYTPDMYRSEVEVTLYFMNGSKTALVPEKRTLSLNMTESLSAAIVQALLEGPESETLLSAVPEGTVLIDTVVEKSICYVDLSAEFRLNHEGSEILENLTVYSLVDSLASIPQIKYVQILIDGEKVLTFKSYVELDKALEPDFRFCE